MVWRDIGERKRLEQELRQAQKMEAIGQLAGGIAHDFNNLLISIIGHATLLKSSISTELEIESANEILRAGERASELTKQLLAFGRKQVLKPTVFDLNTVLPQLDRMLTRILGEQFTVHTQLLQEVLAVRGDQGQIEQVVVNLLTNARDAMPAGGTILIRTHCETLDAERSTQQRLRLNPGEYAVISVEDQGHGMDAQVLSRVFDPFFTTKDPTKGSGLGMSTAYGIIKQSGGDIAVRSRVGQGTTVRVYLPRSQAALSGARETPAKTDRVFGHERILLVEDEKYGGHVDAAGAENPRAIPLPGVHDGHESPRTLPPMPRRVRPHRF